MPYYRVTGEVPRKRHIRFHRPDGGLYSEELMGEEGFSSDSSLLYHTHLPTAITKSEGVADSGQAGTVPNHPLLPRHVRTTALAAADDLVLALLDEYIGVSNTNMHLRAAAGRTARVLVPRPAE